MAWITTDCEHCGGLGEVPYQFVDDYGDHGMDYICCPACKGDGRQVEPDALEIIFDWLDKNGLDR